MYLRINVSSYVSDKTSTVTDVFILLHTTSGKAQHVTHKWGGKNGHESITKRDVDVKAYENHELPTKFKTITGLGGKIIQP